MDTLIEEKMKELEEFGGFHDGFCACMNENDPDECDCEPMKELKKFFEKALTDIAKAKEVETVL